MNNIKQLTNESSSSNTETEQDPHGHGYDIKYKIFSFNEKERIIKIGYCCESCGIGIRIYIKFKNEDKFTPFEIGKTGMFEFQDQNLLEKDEDGNIIEKEKELTEIEAVKLPYEISIPTESDPITQDILFKFDYVILSS